MKRTNPDKLNLVDDREINIDGTVELSKQAHAASCRSRSVAAIGLAIVGASGILLPTGHDAAAATEPVTTETTTEMQPNSQTLQPKTLSVEDETASALVASVNPMVVKVQKGQTLWELSQNYEVDPNTLANANGIRSDSLLQVGQQLKIPSLDGRSLDAKTSNTVATLPSQTRYVDLEQDFKSNQAEQFDASSGEEIAVSESGVKDGVINRWSKQLGHSKAIAQTQTTQEAENLSASRQEVPRQQQQQESTAALEPANERATVRQTLPTLPTDQFNALNSDTQAGLAPQPVGQSADPRLGENVTGTVAIAPTEMVTPSSSAIYNVRPGDTLDAIAQIYGVSVRDLMSANNIIDPYGLKPNQALKIPQIDANSSGEPSVTVIPGSNSTAEATATETATSLMPAQLAPAPSFGSTPSTPIVSVISSLTNATDAASFSVPTVAKTNSIPLTQFSTVGINTQGKSADKAHLKFTGAIAPIPVSADSQNASDATNSNSGLTSPKTELDGNKTATLPSPVQLGSVSRDRVTVAPQEGETAHLPNPYADRLRAEITRLREEYRSDRKNQPEPRSVSMTSPVNNTQMPKTEVLDSQKSELINPEFSPNRYAQAVQHEISTPQAQEWARQFQQQRQKERANATAGMSSVQTLEKTPEQPIVARAPLGADAYDPLSNPSLGRMVSPELPPLPGADTYLPGGSMPSKGFIWPAKGVLTSGYGWRWGRMHKGIDIAGDIGTPIVAVDAGVVTYAEWNDGGYGYLVEITHDNGNLTLYAHNNKLLVQKGQRVAQGQQISEMGSTGFSTGPHLHFEIHPSGQGAVNPMAFLPDDSRSAAAQ
ncbi:hypothetical protein BCD67_13880 [Oscillatoriales cyanobacterium USR001]|nr:hypothetical protein BCD67_13880 [Oscillatoriales cyanobacterium USR001]